MSTTDWRVALTIAGSDSGGGAGIQADLKTFAAHGVFGMSAITAITAQNSQGVTRIELLDPTVLEAQLRAVFDDFPVGVVKIGMLGSGVHAEVVGTVLSAQRWLPPVILDPVMVASTGHRLLTDDGVRAVRALLPLATLATPNREEAEVLGPSDGSLLVTGGDGVGTVEDVWSAGGSVRRIWRGPRIGVRPFHGTGCTLASAIAARLLRGEEQEAAIDGSIRWVRALISHAHLHGGIGHGNPSLAHAAVAPPP